MFIALDQSQGRPGKYSLVNFTMARRSTLFCGVNLVRIGLICAGERGLIVLFLFYFITVVDDADNRLCRLQFPGVLSLYSVLAVSIVPLCVRSVRRRSAEHETARRDPAHT